MAVLQEERPIFREHLKVSHPHLQTGIKFNVYDDITNHHILKKKKRKTLTLTYLRSGAHYNLDKLATTFSKQRSGHLVLSPVMILHSAWKRA